MAIKTNKKAEETISIDIDLGPIKQSAQKAARDCGLSLNGFICNAVESAVMKKLHEIPDDLADQMSVECLVMELADGMVPADEGRQIAERHREFYTPRWNATWFAVTAALMALDTLGYEVRRREADKT